MENVEFEVSPAKASGGAYFCTVTSAVFSRPKRIWGNTAADARNNASRFVGVLSSQGTFRRRVSPRGAVIGALPVAGGAAAADGPLPIGDIVGVVILLGTLAYAAYLSTRTAADEARCEAQYEIDIAECRRVRKPSCYAQAAERYGACLAGRPIPPLNY